MTMLRVTFYSYKGGVGRTLALLNVAAILAGHGRRVVVVDLDLEAPGLGLAKSTRGPKPGVADFLLDRRQGVTIPLEEYSYCIAKSRCLDRLRLIPAGRPDRTAKLVSHLAEFYEDPDSDAADLFQLLLAAIDHELAPDYLLIDSRTGLAEISGVCTVELAQVLVAVCGLNEQNVFGMQRALELIHGHPARQEELATILVFSPIPRVSDLGGGIPAIDAYLETTQGSPAELRYDGHPLVKSLYRAHVALLSPERLTAVRRAFPRLAREDMLHHIFYDPFVPLADELLLENTRSELFESYYRLARTLTRAHPRDESLAPRPVASSIPILHPGW